MLAFLGIDKKKKKKDTEKKTIPRSVQKTIPYVQAYEDGIIEIKKGFYSRTFKFLDINYQIARQDDQEDIFVKYCNFLNFFDSSVQLQISINNRNLNREDFENEVLLKEKNDNLDEYRQEYNEMLRKQIVEGRNDLLKEKYITVTIEAPSIQEARSSLARIETEVHNNFKRLGSICYTLNLKERLEVLHDFYRKGSEGLFTYEPKEHKKKGLQTKDLISPDSFLFKRDYMMIGDKYARAVFVRDIPSFMNDKFISEVTDFGFNLMFTMNINSVEPDKALKIIKKQITGMEANKIEYQKRSLKNGYLEAFIPHELKHSLEEAEELLDDVLNKNQKMFFVNMIIVHLADSKKDLDKDTEMISSVSRKYLIQMGTLNYQQEDGIASVLPIGNNRLKVSRTLTTESTAVFIPFTSQELIQPNGMYYGLNAVSRNLILFNRTTLKNPNGFILGTPGSGKSFSAKREMINVLLNTDDDVIIIDPEREYTRLVENFGGEVIHISAGSKNFINPLDMTMDYADDDEPLLLKSEFVLSLCEVIIGGKLGLTANEKSIIDRCVKKTYGEYIQDFDENKIPTLKSFYEVLKEQTEPEARNISTALELYIQGSLSVFSNQTNIDINNRFVCFDIKDLGKQLKTMGMLIVLDQVWNRITLNRNKGRRTWIYMDEIYLLFQNEYSANFLFELYKRARKWGGIPTGITQNVEDLLKSELARRMLSNSDFLLMLNQAPSDRAELAQLLNISDTQLSYVTNSDAGQGLMFSGNSIIPFIDKFPTHTKLYQMMTTKVDEVRANETEIA